jgi:DNA-directed RNA polymerase specialized sigma24 family protein
MRMTRAQPDTEELLRRVDAGDGQARGALLQRHRIRLKRLIALRLDPRLAARVDPSDVVQEALAEADRRLDRYIQERPLPFYPWLRQLVQDRPVANVDSSLQRTSAYTLSWYEQTLAKRKAKLGADHPQTLTSMNNLGQAYQHAGQVDKALPLLEQALAKHHNPTDTAT